MPAKTTYKDRYRQLCNIKQGGVSTKKTTYGKATKPSQTYMLRPLGHRTAVILYKIYYNRSYICVELLAFLIIKKRLL